MKKAINIISILWLLCGIVCIIYGISIGAVEVSPTTAGLCALAGGLFGIVESFRK